MSKEARSAEIDSHHRRCMVPAKLSDAVVRREALILGGIFLLALVLRLWGIGFGLPYEYHVDEVQYVRQAASMGSRGLEPVWWNNPPFLKYILLAEFGALYVLGHALGWYSSMADFGAQHVLDPSRLYLLGRGTSALMGAATVLVLYWLGKSAYNRRVGLLSALFLAVAFLPVRESHYAVNDTAVTFWMMLVLLASVKIMQTQSLRWYILGGAALGLASATKYSALAAIVPLTISHFLSPGVSRRNLGSSKLGTAFGAMALAAIIASPYFVLTPQRVWQDVYEALVVAARYGFEGWQLDIAGGYPFYLKTLLWGLGWPLALLSMSGALFAVWRHRKVDIVLLSLPLPAYLFMGRQSMYFARLILPLVPPLLVLGASLLDRVVNHLKANRTPHGIVMAGAVLILVVPSLAASVRHDQLLTRPDTRTLAKQLIEQTIPENARIAVDWPFHSPPLSTPERPLPLSSRQYHVTIVEGKGLSDHALEWYRQQGYDYLVTSSYISDIRLIDTQKDVERQAFYAALSEKLKLKAELRPSDNGNVPPFIFDEIYGPAISLWQRDRPGPTIQVYALEGS